VMIIAVVIGWLCRHRGPTGHAAGPDR